MVIVDKALEACAEQGKPIKVAILGGGFMAQGLTNQIVNSVPGMTMVAIYSRKPQKALHVLNYSGLENPIEAVTQSQLDDAIRAGKPAFTQDVMLLARSEHVDLIVDTTGSVEFGAHVVLEAFKHGKDVVLLNAELDATIGPILQTYADKHGVILSACDGDEPGVTDESLSLGEGAWALCRASWVTSRGCRIPIETRARKKISPRDGARILRWLPALLTGRKSASSRRSWQMRPESLSNHAACPGARNTKTT